jgi:transketolase
MTATSTDCAECFSSALLALAETDERICVVINDSVGTHHATAFARRFPDRLIDVGIAEQNMIGVAIGLAKAGRIPFVHSASCFLTARAMEQIKAGLSYSRSNVKLCGFVSGMAYGALGGTHHSLEDIAWMRVLPQMSVVAPADRNETMAMPAAALAHNGSMFIRIVSKMATVDVFQPNHKVRMGKAARLVEGKDVALIGTGIMSGRLLEAARILAGQGVSARVVHLASVSPIDEAEIIAAGEIGYVVTAEDHFVRGGFGSAVAEVLVRERPVPMLSIGVPAEYPPIGSADWLYEHYGLTADKMAARILAWRRRE